MKDYEREKLRLENAQRKLEDLKLRYNPSHMIKLVDAESTKHHKESEKCRKQLKESSITVDQFIAQYVESRTKHYENEIIKTKLRYIP